MYYDESVTCKGKVPFTRIMNGIKTNIYQVSQFRTQNVLGSENLNINFTKFIYFKF